MTGPRIVGDAPIGRDTLPDFGGVGGAAPVVSPLADSVLVSVVSVHAEELAVPAEADATASPTRDTEVDDLQR